MSEQYYAITKLNTTKDDPLFIARRRGGTFERYVQGQWVFDQSLYDILIGDLSDYEDITQTEAMSIIERQAHQYVRKSTGDCSKSPCWSVR